MAVSVFLMVKRLSACQQQLAVSKNESERDANRINSLSHIHFLLDKDINHEGSTQVQGTSKNTIAIPQIQNAKLSSPLFLNQTILFISKSVKPVSLVLKIGIQTECGKGWYIFMFTLWQSWIVLLTQMQRSIYSHCSIVFCFFST